ncbi:1787_t:CDS:2, partial [Racocetra persica]
GQGGFLLAMKGDDGFKRQCNLKLDEERYEKVSQYTALKISLNALSFVDYHHFTKYQQSLRDYVKDFEDDTFVEAYIDANVKMYKKKPRLLGKK